MLKDPESYIQSLTEYFNFEFFGAAWNNVPNAFTLNDFNFINKFTVNDVETLFYKVAGQSICGTVSINNGGIMIGMDNLPE